jgi:D-alanyl-D-alanine carboxypeptidase (penicillin-binding protein 5/6)
MLLSGSPGKKLPIGSLTNIATAMVVLDWADGSKLDLGTLVTVPSGIAAVSENPIGFQTGDQVSLRDLLYAALLQSDNVAAYTLADHIGRNLPGGQVDATPAELFVAQMNALARKLGMQHTKFLNPYGLDTVEHPYSTAQDLATLTTYAMQRSAFCFLVSQKERRIARHLAGGQNAEYNLVNTNKLLGTDAIDGVKTGKTALAGECVVISAVRPPESTQNPDGSVTVLPRRLIVVVLGARDRFSVATRLLNEGWNSYDAWAAAGRPISK